MNELNNFLITMILLGKVIGFVIVALLCLAYLVALVHDEHEKKKRHDAGGWKNKRY